MVRHRQVRSMLLMAMFFAILSVVKDLQMMASTKKYVLDELSDFTSYMAGPTDVTSRPITHFILPNSNSQIQFVEDVVKEKPALFNYANSSVALQWNVTTHENPVLDLILRLRQGLPISKPPSRLITTMIWPLQDPMHKKDAPTPDQLHILKNGVDESPFFELAADGVRSLDNPYLIWMTDVKFAEKVWCQRLATKVMVAQERRRNLSLPVLWPIYVVDFTAPPTHHHCEALEEVMGKELIFYSKRSMAIHRHWSWATNWIDLGEPLPSHTSATNVDDDDMSREYQYIPLMVRTDIVETIQKQLQSSYNSSLSDPIERLPRSVDVAHYWPAPKDETVMAKMFNLRNRLSWLIQRDFRPPYTVVTDTVGTMDTVGRRKAQEEYVHAMLDTKIVVVGQRDLWEDHYRLWEALVSGALVMTDDMLHLSTFGLENGVNCVVFTSEQDFLTQLSHFLNPDHKEERLAIANKGRHLALSKHRSWHRIEEIVFGRPLSGAGCIGKEEHPSCTPYTVHHPLKAEH